MINRIENMSFLPYYYLLLLLSNQIYSFIKVKIIIGRPFKVKSNCYKVIYFQKICIYIYICIWAIRAAH